MEGFSFVDIYATKGIEYLIVIAFLAAIVFFSRSFALPVTEGGRRSLLSDLAGWFRIPEGIFYHQGHGWLKPAESGLVSVGIDDFAQKFVGRVDALELPDPGTWLHQGTQGWELKVGPKAIPMLSPVDGEVIEVNREALANPAILNEDPYGRGWLLKVRPHRLVPNTRGLMNGGLAKRWLEGIAENLRASLREPALGAVAQDGGIPVSGIARALDPEHWDDLAREFLLTGRT